MAKAMIIVNGGKAQLIDIDSSYLDIGDEAGALEEINPIDFGTTVIQVRGLTEDEMVKYADDLEGDDE